MNHILKELENFIKEIIANLLNKPSDTPQLALNLDASFLELGINSLLAVELVETLNQQLLIELGVEVIFDYRDAQELAAFVFKRYGEEGIVDEVRFSEAISSSNKTDVPVIEEESYQNQEVLGERRSSDIAIIGISGRFADSANIEEFWQHLQAGESCIKPIRRKGWETSTYYDPDPERTNRSMSQWGGMLQDIDRFDPLFFNISPLEAVRMDPQQRLFLQEAYKSFEDAGYSAEQLSDKKVGVFVGARSSDYKEQAVQSEEIDSHLFLGSDMAILGARISYFLNCKGPNLTIDTACSSSLVAIHLACESIHTGESEMALAGGVFVLSSPEFYVMTSKTQMLSPDGKCKTFDNTANGIVIGEGVGTVILKPLEAALEDGDHIYGVILGSSVNQDGRTKGITAPSMLSQKALLVSLYKKAAIHPETVSYIEAHGTGTKLGDPIEVKALTEAFHLFTDKTKFCAIGSHKPNFGHTIMTAGIAGVLKILMAMKYKQIPATINIEEVNQHIDLQGSPFFINTELREWKSRDGSPLRAGVSSFGFSGTNCHVILEEPPPQKKQAHEQTRPSYFFPLSAKTKAALSQKVGDLITWLEREGEKYSVEDISYTLVHGRSHFPLRYAVVAGDTYELKQCLRETVNKGESEHDIERGNSLQKERLLQEYGHWLLQGLLEEASFTKEAYKEKIVSLADLYVKGYNLDWEKLFQKGRHHRVPLPTYPFLGESYWITETSRDHPQRLLMSNTGADGLVPQVHPLVQRNTSDFFEQRFNSTFRGDEFFLTDHVVKGQRIMPAVAYLEMARAAIGEAMASTVQQEERSLHLTEVVWIRPLVIGSQPAEVRITLELQGNEKIAFTVRSQARETEEITGKGQDPALYCQGRAELRVGREVVPNVDLTAVQARCQHSCLSPAECYQRFRELSISYGPTMQGIEQLNIGEDEVLARFREPVMVAQTRAGFVLHPSLLDSAFQACMALLREPQLPFDLEDLSIIGQLPASGWAWVRRRQRSATGSVFDIEMCDDAGHLMLRLHGLRTRKLSSLDAQDTGASTTSLVGTLRLFPLWDLTPLSPASETNLAKRTVIIGGTAEEQSAIVSFSPYARILEIPVDASIESLREHLTGVAGQFSGGHIEQVLWLVPHDPLLTLTQESLLLAQQEGVLQCFRLIKAFLLLGYGSQTLGFTVISREMRTLHKAETVNPTHASLLGLFGSLAKEYPHWRILQVDLAASAPLPLAEMQRLPPDHEGQGWLYRDGHWHREILVPVNTSTEHLREPYRKGGVYVVIGGAGGIGEVWSEYLIRTYQARIIWIGRREKTAAIDAKLRRLASMGGPTPDYVSADATKRSALEQARQQIKQRYGQIHGVVHSAIVLRDQSLANMDEAQFQAALSAKVDVSVRLAQVFEHEPLDFVLFFSSFNAFLRSAGQSNYAAGCTFEGAFAARLRQDWPCQVKVINWGYWGSVGVVASAPYRERLEQMGLGSLEPAEAMQALEDLLAGPSDQMVLLKTTQPVTAGLTPGGELIETQQMITIYPERLPSSLHKVVPLHVTLTGQREPSFAETLKAMQEMEELLCQFLWSHLQSLGLFREKQVLLTDVREQAGISTSYDHWLQVSVVLLEQKQYLHCPDASVSNRHTICTVSNPALVEGTTLWQSWDEHKEHWMRHADLKAQVTLVETTVRALPAILTGKRPATEILFPNGSLQLVEGIYHHQVIADSFNDILSLLIATYLQERLTGEEHARIRILEIGAGMGATTGRVLQMLEPYRASIAEYCYSDISEAFLRHGQGKYAAGHPYLTYRLFNVEKPLAEQGIEAGGYDLVIAANVLHATSNIRRTVRNAKAALKKHGWLLLNEITGTSLFLHLTFGLLPGWWAYEDPEWRVPGGPALTTESWQAILGSEGFEAISLPTWEVQEAGQQVIVAESDGAVRQSSVQREQEDRSEALDLHLVAPMRKVPVPPDNLADAPLALPLSEALRLNSGDNTDEILREKSIAYLKGLVGKVLNLPSTKINATEPLTNYGLDSILVLQLTGTLRTAIEQVSSTLFFEYATIDALVEHFLHTQKQALERLVDVSRPASPDLALTPRRFLTGEQRGDKKDGGGDTLETEADKGKPLPLRSPERDIAIIGVAGRYPGAKDVQSFWELLSAGKSAISEIPGERWDWSHYFQAKKGTDGHMYTKWGGFLENIESFDALFFHISPREAEQMDPQERLFLEVSYTCIQDAGYTPAMLQESGPVGVFVGVMNGNYPTGVAYWSIANRVSFVLGLQGPSVAVDTACSSSLTALHFAVESLMSGTCACAIVGGVNLIVDPVHYTRLSQAGMLTTSDQCKSFGENADGFVDGEGVGALLLKPKLQAEVDGDHIYGVIKGTAINHGGHSNGYAVPSPQAQAEVIKRALKEAKIDPRTISYIEAHGTGTELGDPIEIAGLTHAFRDPGLAPGGTQDNGATGRGQAPTLQAPGWCAIGSVKSNIGHAEGAAGIAGVTKVLLQMRYGQLVPSLHAEVLNQHIDFSATPFVVQRGLSDWKRPRMPGSGKEVKRRAGVSSFGAGGSNAHVILEEYVQEHETSKEVLARPSRPALIVLSARTPEQLHEQAQQLLAWIQQGEQTQETLDNLAYTLQVGREAMEERLALQVDSLADLSKKLHRFLQEPQKVEDWYRGQVKQYDPMRTFAADEDGQQTVRAWISKGKYEKLLAFWVKGLTIDWNHLYGEQRPRRVSLPTYPFARERYWITTSPSRTVPSASAWGISTSHTMLHPLVQRNTSTLWEQRFSSTFRGDEFFLVDHVVRGEHIMPAAAYLEMACAAVREAIGVDATREADRLSLSHVVWVHPLVCDPAHPTTACITLSPQESGKIAFVISRAAVQDSLDKLAPQEEGTTELLYCQGTAELHAENTVEATANLRLDPVTVQARCQHHILAPSCYRRYREQGIDYGSAFQGIEQLSVGEGEVLARLSLPAVVAQTHTEGGCRDGVYPRPLPYVLHPSMLDAALQACIGFLMEPNAHLEPRVPFALEDLSILGRTPASGWAWVRRRSQTATESVFDVLLCDDEGRVAVSLRGLSVRPLLTEEETSTVLLTPDWKEEAISPSELSQQALVPTEPLVLLCDLPETFASRIQGKMASGGRCLSLVSTTLRREQRFQDTVVQLIQELQHLLQSPRANVGKGLVPSLVQVVVAHTEEPSRLSALAGILKTAEQEYPQLRGQLIEVEGESEEEELLVWLHENQRWSHESHIRYRDGKRCVREWRELPEISPLASLPWKEDGCYLITGGAGGLARLLVQEIARHVLEATVILVGRSTLSASQRAQLEPPQNSGIRIDYQQVDVNDSPAVHALIKRVIQTSGHLDGIIHAAGVLRDSLLFNKTPEEVQAVLAPKVIGVEHLDEASREVSLDFFILCSSLSAVVGNVGQADYAAANAYLDAFAHARAAQVAAGERQGTTVSINWPLWEEGNMQIEAEERQTMRKQLGIEVMGTETGMKMLYQALASGLTQVLVAHGQVERIKRRLLQRAESPLEAVAVSSAPPEEKQATRGQEALQERANTYFKKQLAALIKLPVQRVDAQVPLIDYGFDSILAIRFINSLEGSFGPLSKTLLFECPTLQSVTEYFLRHYPEQLRSVLRIEDVSATVMPQITGRQTTPLRRSTRPRKGLRQGANPWPATPGPDTETKVNDIAIIGVAGRYPGARDLGTFWENLRTGKDCITEIPPERWDHRLHFDPDKNKPGTTYSKWGGFLDGVDEFDPLFFNISPREAEIMDPQERLFLECVYATLEDAGYTRAFGEPRSYDRANGMSQGNGLAGKVGVFVGVMYEEYQLLGAQEQIQGRPVAVSGSPSSIANRVSYVCNFHGPSLAVDTMCSSSLTALHLACQSIQHDGCEVAVAGGVNVSIHPNKYLLLGQGKFVSSQGHCESFGVGADGYVPGEGVGAVLLKPLVQAEADGDHIYAVIKATAINHGGKTNGYSVPNPLAQAEVIGQALKDAGIDPRTISYIEAHGTGTVLGDPIEIAGLTRAFEQGTQDKQYCAIGSVKSNIGHAESAAGIAGVTKVLLQMRYGQLVPSLHAEVLNPHIDFSATPFVVQQELSEWKRPQVPGTDGGDEVKRRAGISSFGAGGSNAHVILEEYVETEQGNDERKRDPLRPILIVLSARTEEQLHERVRQLLAWIQEAGGPVSYTTATEAPVELVESGQASDHRLLDNLAYTLQVGREAMEERLALQVSSLAELSEKLQRYHQDPQEEGGWYRGGVRQHKETVELFSTDEELQEVSSKWFQRGKYEKLLSWWVKGLKISWQHLYTVGGGSESHTSPLTPAQPRRISLPTYPFARESYWLPAYHRDGGSGTQPAVPATRQPSMPQSPFHVQRSGSDVAKPDEMLALTTSYLVNVLSTALKIGPEKLDDEVGFDEYGLDSIIVQRLHAILEEVFGSIPVTLFFQYKCISDLARYFLKEHAETMHALFVGATASPLDANLGASMGASYVSEATSPVLPTEAYPCPSPDRISVIHHIQHHIPDQRAQIESLHAAPGQPAQEMDEILIRLLWVQLQTSGWFTQPRVSVAGLKARVSLPTGYNRWLDETIAVFAQRKYLRYDASSESVTDPISIDAERIWHEWEHKKAIWLPDPDLKAQVTLVEATLNALPEILTGQTTATAILFPKSSFKLLEGIYQHNRTTDFFNTILADIVVAYLSETIKLERSTRLRILEIGAGTGGTSAMIFQKLLPYQEYIQEYCYTDLSQAFLWHAEQVYGPENPYLTSRIFNVEMSLDDQGMTPGSYDLVIAANVLHATSDIRRSLRNAKALLKQHGLLLLNETSVKSVFLHLTFGLLEGWWLYEDPELRLPGCPFLTPETWQTVLQQEGFHSLFLPKQGTSTLGQQIIVAEASVPSITGGVERQLPSRLDIAKPDDLLALEQGIAIIGISGHYPQAESLDAFWSNLESGRDCITEIPQERWDYRKYYQPKNGTGGKTGGMYCRWGGFLSDIDTFDPSFFHISPLEARFMDPQERLFLQTAAGCFEDAGYSKHLLRDESAGDGRANVGVFVGVTNNNYQLYLMKEYEQGNVVPISSQTYSIANRVSYIYNLRGPSVSLDTACSSSLFAIHSACESIKRGECAMAIAGGVNLSLHPSKYITLCVTQFASSDGRCRSFGEDGDGYVPGEGVGAVLLKPLRNAMADGDHIYAVIKGSAVNNDGKTFGYTVPNPVAQTEVIRKALEVAHVHPRSISYVEAHGTGTKLGDPIEITGLSDAFKEYTAEKQYCAIGSVKSNIGHLELAAGISQVTKVVLQMKHKKLVPSLLHTSKLNPHIDFEKTPFFVQQSLQEWKQPVLQVNGEEVVSPRRAGISSFGAGGVNVHLVLEEHQAKDDEAIRKELDNQPVIIVLSAHKEQNLREYAQLLKEYMEKCLKDPSTLAKLKDVAYTLQTGRDPMPYRLAFTASDPEEILQKLSLFLNSREPLGKEGVYIGYRRAETKQGTDEAPDDLETVQSSVLTLEKMAQLWTSGREIDWKSRYQNERHFKVPLPTYPFSKERYWIGEQLEEAVHESPAKVVEMGTSLDRKGTSPTSTRATPDRQEQAPPLQVTSPPPGGDDSQGRSLPPSALPQPRLTPSLTPVRKEEGKKPEMPEIHPFLVELCQALEGERQRMVERYMQDTLARLLAFCPPDMPELQQGFFDMGMESVMVEQFRVLLEAIFPIKIPGTVVFDYMSISELSEYIVKHVPFSEIENPHITESLYHEKTVAMDITTTPDENVAQEAQVMNLEDVVAELKTLLNEQRHKGNSPA